MYLQHVHIYTWWQVTTANMAYRTIMKSLLLPKPACIMLAGQNHLQCWLFIDNVHLTFTELACYILQNKFLGHSVKITTWKYGSICTLRLHVPFVLWDCMLPECRTMLLNVIQWPTNGPMVRLWINKSMENPAT